MQYHIVMKNLSKSYRSKGVTKTALSDVSLNIPQGEIFCIMGSSGSGKSTLLKILGGIEKPTSGTVYINGSNMADYRQQDYEIENGKVYDTLRREGTTRSFYERIVTVSSKVRGVI